MSQDATHAEVMLGTTACLIHMRFEAKANMRKTTEEKSEYVAYNSWIIGIIDNSVTL